MEKIRSDDTNKRMEKIRSDERMEKIRSDERMEKIRSDDTNLGSRDHNLTLVESLS